VEERGAERRGAECMGDLHTVLKAYCSRLVWQVEVSLWLSVLQGAYAEAMILWN